MHRRQLFKEKLKNHFIKKQLLNFPRAPLVVALSVKNLEQFLFSGCPSSHPLLIFFCMWFHSFAKLRFELKQSFMVTPAFSRAVVLVY